MSAFRNWWHRNNPMSDIFGELLDAAPALLGAAIIVAIFIETITG